MMDPILSADESIESGGHNESTNTSYPQQSSRTASAEDRAIPPVDMENSHVISVIDNQFPGLVCEDCLSTAAIRTWRWCRKCERVLCESCAVDRHVYVGEAIDSYATAVRRENEKFQNVINAADTTMKILRDKAEKIRNLEQTIELRTKEIVLGKIAITNDGEEFHAIIDGMNSLASKPVNAQWMTERAKIQSDFETLLEKVKGAQNNADKRLKETSNSVTKLADKLDSLFHGTGQ